MADEEREEDYGADLGRMGVIRIGDVLGTGARAIGQRFGTFLVVTLVILAPTIAAQIAYTEWTIARAEAVYADPNAFGSNAYTDFALMAAFGGLGTAIVEIVLLFLAQAVLMYATVEFMAGRHASIGASLKGGLSRAHVVIAVAFLQTIAIGLGLLACIVPGIMLACLLYASVPAAVAEDAGPFEAMRRSAELTDGHRGTIFLVLLIVGVVSRGLDYLIQESFAVGPNVWGQSPLYVRAIHYTLSNVLLIATTMFQAAVAAVFYARVRGIKDGVDADAIADVFK